MRRTKKTYAEDFRRQVVQELLTGPESGLQVARRYGISSGLLSNWCKRYEREGSGEVEGDMPALQKRVADLERMVGRLTMENDFLKKFAVYAKQQTNERMSIVTAKSLASRKPVSSLGLPAAPTITEPRDKPQRTAGLKNA